MGVSTGNFYINTKGIHSISIALSSLKGQAPKAMASAINRTLDYTKTQLIREVTGAYSIKRKDITPKLKSVRASTSFAYAALRSKGKTTPLGKFPHSPSTYSPKSKSIKVKVKKSEGYQAIKNESGKPKAFVQSIYGWAGNDKGSGIYRRVGAKRFPVISLRSLSVPQMISNADVMGRIQKASEKKLEERINHEIKYRIDKAAGRVK